ncbi:SusD/RagB family nutrient-binding outer membrane lipoprotein [Bacteroides salyersiae]|nr:SusD/RagB family nutrient-binding outer membrane lipoprotein [Bacteroides salyersiae]
MKQNWKKLSLKSISLYFPTLLRHGQKCAVQSYPKTLPVLNWEDADANLQEGDLLRRMRFPGTDTQAVAADVAATGLKALGGADLQSTRIWWDVEGTPNF